MNKNQLSLHIQGLKKHSEALNKLAGKSADPLYRQN